MTEKTVAIVLPHQLYKENPALEGAGVVLLVEDPLFFFDKKYPVYFHKQKLMFHRATMKQYQKMLEERGFVTHYVEAKECSYFDILKKMAPDRVQMVDPVDCIADKRLDDVCKKLFIERRVFDSPGFLSTRQQIANYFKGLSHYSFTPFYITCRKVDSLLLDEEGKPLGGKWTYDQENRKKMPSDLFIPPLPKSKNTPYISEARSYVEKEFPNCIGLATDFIYPTSHKEAEEWLASFLESRLELFGPYQDAIVDRELLLMHSLLSPLLNVGLLTPSYVVKKTVEYSRHKEVPLASLEGFLRQVMGWREFVRGVYQTAHVTQRKKNFWNHKRKIPHSFYSATTGIEPVDETIKKLQKYAYCHHIERLMVLGSFMLLAEFDPDEVYRWFMEMFIDSYDWVMVPNVYGMSQFADGGLMTTKPYICSSNYILKMSNYKKGPWCDIWDGLFWRFMKKHESFFKNQPRLGLLLSSLAKVDSAKLAKAEAFLSTLK